MELPWIVLLLPGPGWFCLITLLEAVSEPNKLLPCLSKNQQGGPRLAELPKAPGGRASGSLGLPILVPEGFQQNLLWAPCPGFPFSLGTHFSNDHPPCNKHTD